MYVVGDLLIKGVVEWINVVGDLLIKGVAEWVKVVVGLRVVDDVEVEVSSAYRRYSMLSILISFQGLPQA